MSVANESSSSRGIFSIVKEALADFMADNALTHAAAVAFYTALSFAPLLMLTVFIFGQLDAIAGTGTQDRVIEEIRTLIGGQAAAVVSEVESQQEEQNLSLLSFSGIIGIIALIWSASGVFAQLQNAMNTIWDVEQAPGQGIWGFARTRLLSIGMVFSIIFLLLASLIVTALLTAILGGEGIIWQVVHFVVSLLVYVALFAAMFKYLPDVRIPWKAVWFGAAVTGALFVVGKFLIGLYLGQSDPGSAYGGAGSIVVLLIWVYYSGLILFVGAELTQVWAKRSGVRILPDEHARAVGGKEKEPANEAAVDRRAKEASGAVRT